MMILYLMYMGDRWLGGDLMFSKTSWICILGYEDLFLFVVYYLASCIVLKNSESRKFTFTQLSMIICIF